MADGKLASGKDYRNRHILQHERQHGSGVRHGVGAVDHHDPLISGGRLIDSLRQPAPVVRKYVGAVHQKQILHLQFDPSRHQPHGLQKFPAA